MPLVAAQGAWRGSRLRTDNGTQAHASTCFRNGTAQPPPPHSRATLRTVATVWRWLRGTRARQPAASSWQPRHRRQERWAQQARKPRRCMPRRPARAGSGVRSSQVTIPPIGTKPNPTVTLTRTLNLTLTLVLTHCCLVSKTLGFPACSALLSALSANDCLH